MFPCSECLVYCSSYPDTISCLDTVQCKDVQPLARVVRGGETEDRGWTRGWASLLGSSASVQRASSQLLAGIREKIHRERSCSHNHLQRVQLV